MDSSALQQTLPIIWRRFVRLHLPWAVIAAGIVILFACGGEEVTDPTTPTTPEDNTVASVVLSTTNDTLYSASATLQLTATANNAGGTSISGKTFTWASSNNTIVTVNSSGMVTATGPNGSATITATTDGVPANATIVVATGAMGGTVIDPTGQVTLQVPAGAVSDPLSITVTPATAYPDAARVVGGTAFEFGPDGTVFADEVDLTIEYDPADMPAGTDENLLRIHRLTGGAWSVVSGGSVNTSENTATAPISGFSIYAILESEDAAACIALLETALDGAINGFYRVEPIDFDNLDQFSFVPAQECFQDYYDATNTPELASEREVAAFGLAWTTMLVLEDDASLRAAAEEWQAWNDAGNGDIGDITRGTGIMPPTLEEQQTLANDIVAPALVTALSLLDEVDDPEFDFPLTAMMQGEEPGSVDPLEIDQAEVIATRAFVEAALASIDILLAYQTVPSPYGPTGFSAAMADGSTFLTLSATGTTRLATALERMQTSVDLLGEAFDFLVAEMDDQTDDVVGYEAAGQYSDCELVYEGPFFPCRLNAQDVQDVRDVLTDIDGVLGGPHTIEWESHYDEILRVDVVVDLSQFFLNPIADLKAILPAYDVANGEFNWVALAFDEWLFPDPDLNGILPDITSSEDLRGSFWGNGLWEEGAYDIDGWGSIAVNPVTGGLSAITIRGNLYSISSDFSIGSDRPDITTDAYAWAPIRLTYSTVASELVAIDYEGGIYSRPDDAATEWLERMDISEDPWWYCCGFTRLVENPISSGYYTVRYEIPLEISADFTTVTQGPWLPYEINALAANTTTSLLIGISYDGLVYARPPDAATEWTQRHTLSFSGNWEDQWIGITQAPADGDIFAITQMGNLYEIASGFVAAADRPDVPATNVVDLISTPSGLLIALTGDGRVFSRPDDASTQWTLRFTLPRNLLP